MYHCPNGWCSKKASCPFLHKETCFLSLPSFELERESVIPFWSNDTSSLLYRFESLICILIQGDAGECFHSIVVQQQTGTSLAGSSLMFSLSWNDDCSYVIRHKSQVRNSSSWRAQKLQKLQSSGCVCQSKDLSLGCDLRCQLPLECSNDVKHDVRGFMPSQHADTGSELVE